MAKSLLTHSECKQILTAYHGQDSVLREFKIRPALDAHGYLGEYYQLTLMCEKLPSTNLVELNCFIKSVSESSEEVEKMEIFEKEGKLYATLLNELQTCTTTVWCPKAFYTRSNLIVLEDLCSLGYEKKDLTTKSLTDEELRSLLKALAALHASSIIYEKKRGIQLDEHFPPKLFKEITVSRKIAWFTTGLKTILDLVRYQSKYQTINLQNLARHLECVYEMQEPSQKYRNVLCHRDPWHSNVLFNYVTKNAILVDFQTVRYCPPAIDVIFALFLNLDSNTRNFKESEYLIWYFEKLKTELLIAKIYFDDHINFAEFLKSYDEFKLFGYLYRAMAFTLINVPKEFVTNDYKYVSRTEKLSSYMRTNKDFCIQMESCIEELLDYTLSTRSSEIC